MITAAGDAGTKRGMHRSQSGLLQVHSQVPGRYYSYDYSNAVKLADRTLPRQVTVNEGGRAVSTITVEASPTFGGRLRRCFSPEQDEAKGGPSPWERTKGIAHVRAESAARTTMAQTVCVFGVVTPSDNSWKRTRCSLRTLIARRRWQRRNR